MADDIRISQQDITSILRAGRNVRNAAENMRLGQRVVNSAANAVEGAVSEFDRSVEAAEVLLGRKIDEAERLLLERASGVAGSTASGFQFGFVASRLLGLGNPLAAAVGLSVAAAGAASSVGMPERVRFLEGRLQEIENRSFRAQREIDGLLSERARRDRRRSVLEASNRRLSSGG